MQTNSSGGKSKENIMKLIEFKEYNNLNGQVLNKKKVVLTGIISGVIIIALLLVLIYLLSPKFRGWADIHILMKVVNQGSVPTIDYDYNTNTSIIPYDKYVAMLNNNQLNIYNSAGKKMQEIDVKVSTPIVSTNGRYVVIAEKDKEKIYVISGTKILWSKDLSGNISRVNINENGYVSAVCSGTTYKSVVNVFDKNGNELFKTYIPSNKVVDTSISSDNKFVSIAEVDTSGTLIKSTVKTISIKDAKNSPESSVVSTYEMPTNSLIVNIRYQGSKNLICMRDDGISILSDGKIQNLYDFSNDDKKYSFAGIDMINNVYVVEESSKDISNQMSSIILTNSGTKRKHTYKLKNIAKDTLSAGDIVAINLGTEVYFIDSKGWLKKKFVANEEIKDVVISDRISAIIFKDHVEIVVL